MTSLVHLLYRVWLHNPAGVVIFDLLWLVVAVRLARALWARVLIAAFCLFETAAYLITRTAWVSIWHVPRWAADAERIWNWVGPIMALVLGAIALALWIRRRAAPAPAQRADPSRRDFLRLGVTAAPVIIIGGLDVIALREGLRTRAQTLAIPRLPRHLDGIKIVQLSDLHVGPYTSARVLGEMVRRVNELEPDLVVVTGDWINRDLVDLPAAISLLHRVDTRYGICGIEGNHDLLDDPAEFRRQVRAAGIPLLLDQSQIVFVRGGPLQLLGIRWAGQDLSENGQTPPGTAAAVAAVSRQRLRGVFPLLLAHHPHAFDTAISAGFPLTLAGHTHGGQMMLTDHVGIGPAIFRYWSGWYAKRGCQLFVSNGVGNFFPLRVNAPAEVVSLTLRTA